MNEVDNPLEPFKRATTAAIRAIAENDELDINFGPGAPAVQGERLRFCHYLQSAMRQKSMLCVVLVMSSRCGIGTIMHNCILALVPRVVQLKKCLSGSSGTHRFVGCATYGRGCRQS